jgi:surface polysaccharide O-acyltransferase-like enzyme
MTGTETSLRRFMQCDFGLAQSNAWTDRESFRMEKPMRPSNGSLENITILAQSDRQQSGLVDRRAAAAGLRESRSSLALSNLRGVVILIVVAFHSVLAYLGSLGTTPFGFDASPYQWRAFPIIDTHRWFGFDLFCASQDVYLMAFMFFLSAVFTWPSLGRKTWRRYLGDRLLRLGVPFLLALFVIMPIALYPVYRTTATAPGLADYVSHYISLPFLPNGPMWFLWELLALTISASLLHRFVPRWIERMGAWTHRLAARPAVIFTWLVVASIFAYVPLALAWSPWDWNETGPFALQFSRPLLYALFYLGGLAVGANGLDRGLLAHGGRLAHRWALWLVVALVSLLAWMGLTALSMRFGATAPFGLQIAVDVCFVLACAGGSFCVLAAALRFGARRSDLLQTFARNAFGIYLVHYMFVVWLQYALLDTALPAIVKATIVFVATVLLSWGVVSAFGLLSARRSHAGRFRRAPLAPRFASVDLVARKPV